MARPRQVSDPSILAAARDCFLQHGPAVSTSVIAERAGTSQALLFQRFGTKEALMRAALAPADAPTWLLDVERGPDDRPIVSQLEEMGERIHDYFGRLLPGLQVLRAAGYPMECTLEQAVEPPPLRSERVVAEWLARAADRGRIRPCNYRHVAAMFLGALHVRPFQRHLLGRDFTTEDDRAYIQGIARMIWHTLDPQSEQPRA